MTAPTSGIDDVVHQRHRLGILTIASELDAVEFGFLIESLELTAGNLSRHLAALSDANLIDLRRKQGQGRPRTWVRLTPAGAAALQAEIDALTQIVQRYQTSR